METKNYICKKCGSVAIDYVGNTEETCPKCEGNPDDEIDGRLEVNAKAIAGVAHSQQLAIRGGEPMNGDDIDDFIKVFKMELRKLNGDIAS